MVSYLRYQEDFVLQFSDTYYAWLAGFIVLTGLSFVLKNERRKLLLDLFLVFATLFVAGSIYTSMETRKGGNAAILESDKAEFSLKMNSAVTAVGKKIGVGKESPVEQTQDKFYTEADKSLTKAIQTLHDPVLAVPVVAKRAILLAEWGKSDFRKPLAELKKTDDPKAKDLYNILNAIYVEKHIDPNNLDQTRALIEKNLKPGWYREVLEVQIEKAAGRTKEFQKKVQAFMEHYEVYMFRLLCFAVLVIVAALVGFIIVVAQLFFLPRTPSTEEERALIAAPGDWSWKVVYGVFVGWLSVQYLIVPMMSGAAKQLATIATERGALSVAVMTAGLYLLQNVPALLFAWFLAYRPAGIKFLEGVRFRTRVGKTGLFQLILAGVLTWFAAIPLVIISSLIAMKLGSQGSGNPIVAIVLSAAKDPNPLAAIMFLITLGVLPALCEESLFRGFLYTSLRRKWGIFPSVMFTALLFSLAHQDVGGAIQLFVLGALFAFVFERTKSVIPAMVAHCMWNSASFLTALAIFG